MKDIDWREVSIVEIRAGHLYIDCIEIYLIYTVTVIKHKKRLRSLRMGGNWNFYVIIW